jgi:hypothetical protein
VHMIQFYYTDRSVKPSAIDSAAQIFVQLVT